ncbi:extracellular solute-binding protein [Paenibacillus doosanensis]|uniref:ABC transporter substrate-binding protein YesO n=1 Tax=Paenibacillus konkukensis TaxID=2020716 RepID=A0ABY4RY82_9BACL|nr:MULTISPECIES: extracellular solute-binding protein [Paenibacillus]MCS7459328.1 extracellular solute-binding protein [Paenibacillus doosanensis]UQZ87122.1 Putative ABC transporter substrate-binding protein YesO [Paenibacillus konkukensis]
MKPWMKKTMLLSVSAGLIIPTLAGCTKAKSADTNTERVLRIATSMGYGPDDEYFRQQFTEIFEFANPNIKIEIIPTMDDSYYYGRRDPNEKPVDPMDKLKEAMQGDNPPDVVMVGYEQLPDLISNNLLTQLDPMITKDKFDTSDMVPAVIEGLKKVGDGKLYAMTPTFNSSALIYNKAMFDEAGVPYPTDKMTWEEAFDLGRRLAKGEGENRKYGFSFSTQSMGDIYYSMQMYTAPLQLTMFDDKGEKMTVDSDQWERVWKTMLQLKQDKIIPEQQDPAAMKSRMMGGGEDFNPFSYDDFLSSRVAMSIINYGQINQITNANKNAQNYKGFTPIDWDVVTLPVHPEAPDVGGYIGMNGIMGINAKAQNVEDAWKFIKFVNGEDWARLKSSSSYNIVTRKKFIKPKDGVQFHIDAFTTLTPAPQQDYRIYREKPDIGQVQEIGHQLFNDVTQGKMQVRDALKKWQTDGDALLQKIKESPNGQINGNGGVIQAVPAG